MLEYSQVLSCTFQTVVMLGEVCDMLQTLQDQTSAEVHAICPEAQAAVRSILAEHEDRPSSVESIYLTHPHVYSPTYKTSYNQYENR